jgi:hypothetical protein
LLNSIYDDNTCKEYQAKLKKNWDEEGLTGGNAFYHKKYLKYKNK